MLPTSSSRKPLLRSNSERERSGMRNWPLFGFLFALVFFFYVVYIYQAQSAELEALKEQFDNQVLLARNTKNELIDQKAEVEKLKSQVSQLVFERDDLKSKNTELSSSLRSCTLKSEQVQSEKTKADDNLKEKETLIETLQKDANELPSVKSLLSAQEKISEQLNQTILALKDELTVLKSAKLNAPAAPAASANQAAAPASPVVTTVKTGNVEAVKVAATTTLPVEAPKIKENVIDRSNDSPKIQTLEKEDEKDEETLADQKKEEGASQVDAPKNVLVKEDDDDKEVEEPVKVKAGEYDDKPEV